MNKLTIITINLNNLEGLERTYNSVTSQTFKEFEYIIIDGGSDDGSLELIKSNSKKIDYWISEPDTGIYNAMNKGIKKANGEYLLFLNSGDEFYNSNVLKENIHQLHKEDIVYFNLCQSDDTQKNICSYPENLDYRTFIEGSIGHPSTFIKKSLFDKYGFYDESFKIVSDWKFFFELIINYKVSSRKVDKVLSVFYKDGISNLNSELLKKERNIVLEFDFKNFKRLYYLELFLNNLKKSKAIKVLNYLGFLKSVQKV